MAIAVVYGGEGKSIPLSAHAFGQGLRIRHVKHFYSAGWRGDRPVNPGEDQPRGRGRGSEGREDAIFAATWRAPMGAEQHDRVSQRRFAMVLCLCGDWPDRCH